MMDKALFVVESKKTALTPEEARDRNQKDGTCPICHTPVRLYRKLTPQGPKSHFKHLEHQKDCLFAV